MRLGQVVNATDGCASGQVDRSVEAIPVVHVGLLIGVGNSDPAFGSDESHAIGVDVQFKDPRGIVT